ncbi:MAG: hypothetical protein IT579_16260 [Verrucomicrobia subdivision 3 bacterium]|nr:hypothetical protein [Limisphaerales bacterium]
MTTRITLERSHHCFILFKSASVVEKVVVSQRSEAHSSNPQQSNLPKSSGLFQSRQIPILNAKSVGESRSFTLQNWREKFRKQGGQILVSGSEITKAKFFAEGKMLCYLLALYLHIVVSA